MVRNKQNKTKLFKEKYSFFYWQVRAEVSRSLHTKNTFLCILGIVLSFDVSWNMEYIKKCSQKIKIKGELNKKLRWKVRKKGL